MGNQLQHIVAEWRRQKKGVTRRTVDIVFTFPKPWSLFCFPAEIQPPQVTGAFRKEYESTIQDDYKRTVQDLCDTYPSLRPVDKDLSFDGLECHHVIPLHVGGTNEHLAFIPRNTHERIHRFINAQIFGLTIGQQAEILIPYFPALIWSDCPQIGIEPLERVQERRGRKHAKNKAGQPTSHRTLIYSRQSTLKM
jgi:hypothetical protein